VSLGAEPAATTSGHISKGIRRQPRIIFVDQPEPEPEALVVEQKRMLRMTPEVKALIEKYKRKGPSTDGLMGKKKGLL